MGQLPPHFGGYHESRDMQTGWYIRRTNDGRQGSQWLKLVWFQAKTTSPKSCRA